MDYFWKENKGYVIAVGCGVLAAFIWYAYVVGGVRQEANRVRRLREGTEAALQRRMAAGVPSEDVVDRARRDLERSKKLVEELRADLALRVPESYVPPGSKTPGEFFQSHKVEVGKRVFDAAARQGVGLPDNSLGFPPVTEASDDLAQELLARLAIVEKLATGAVQANVEKIDSVNACVGAPPEDGPVRRKGMFLNRCTVRMKVTGASKAVFEWLHGVQRKGDLLVVDDFRAEKLSPHEDRFAAEMEVSGLVIDAAGSLVEKKEGE